MQRPRKLRSLESSTEQRKMKVALFFALVGVYLASGNPIDWLEIRRNFLQSKPLDLEFCKGLGYEYASGYNFFLEKNSSQTKKNAIFRAFSLLDRMGCSNLIRAHACAIFAPEFVDVFGAVPPCRSMCTSIEKSCKPFLKFSNVIMPQLKSGKPFGELYML